MKILSLHNSHHTPAVEDHVFAHEIDPLRRHGHQVFLYQGIPAQQTPPLGAGE
jgi:hypothetical protein